MVEFKFTYPEDTGYPFRRDQATFENIAKDRIKTFFKDKKLQEILKEPMILELVISKNKEITPTLPNGEVLFMSLEEALDAWAKLIEELRNI